MDAPAPSQVAALSGLFAGEPSPAEALRLLEDPSEGAWPEGLAVLAGLYGLDSPEPSPEAGPVIGGP